MFNKKTQIEITNIMFMHLIGIIGILTFTFLFVSLIASSSARAEGLNEESIYYNFGRRLISSPDCFAYQLVEPYYDGTVFSSITRPIPGTIDMSKLLDYEHQNCLRYDMVSGSVYGDPTNAFATFPVILYEITVMDLVNESLTFSFVNDVYETVTGGGVIYEICDPLACMPGCLFDCDELSQRLKSGLEISGTSLECANGLIPDEVKPGENCWLEVFNDVARRVKPYEHSLNCSIPSTLLGTPQEAGKVFETSLQYAVTLRYPTGFNNFIKHPGIFNVKFCVVKIPTMCDPFFGHESFGFFDFDVYNPELCASMGLPLI